MIFSPVDDALGAGALLLTDGAAEVLGGAALADWDEVFEPQATTIAALVPPKSAAFSTVRRLIWRGDRPSGPSSPAADRGISVTSKAVTDCSSSLAKSHANTRA